MCSLSFFLQFLFIRSFFMYNSYWSRLQRNYILTCTLIQTGESERVRKKERMHMGGSEWEDKAKLGKLSEAVRGRKKQHSASLAWDRLFEVAFGMWEDESDAGFAYAQMIGPNAYIQKTVKQRDVWGDKATQNHNIALSAWMNLQKKIRRWLCRYRCVWLY